MSRLSDLCPAPTMGYDADRAARLYWVSCPQVPLAKPACRNGEVPCPWGKGASPKSWVHQGEGMPGQEIWKATEPKLKPELDSPCMKADDKACKLPLLSVQEAAGCWSQEVARHLGIHETSRVSMACTSARLA